jgi:hypothetical protein
MVVFSSELLAYYDLTFIILVSTAQGRGIGARFFKLGCSCDREDSTGQARGISFRVV